MKKTFLPIALTLLLVSSLSAQQVTYDVSFPNRVHHEAEITVTFSGISGDEPLEVRMSRTSPGRYALHEFAKNVYNVDALDGSGEELIVTRPNPYQWNVEGHDGTVQMSYTLFGDRADGTYAGFNTRYAHMNMPATLMWARGMEDAPVRVNFEIPEADWEAATQLFPADQPGSYTAPNFYYLMDSPTHIGRLSWRSWEVKEDAGTYSVRIALDHDGTEFEFDQYADGGEKIFAEQVAMWQDIPDYETGAYTFIVTYLPYVNGDGMEHRNSTIVNSTLSLADGVVDRLGTFSHELFHSWNVERLRPATLEPFDFEEANMSGELWLAEGFTSYYTDVFIRRAGLIDDSEYANRIGWVVNTVETAPGRRYFSAVEMSMQAPFVDAATSVDRQNKGNTFISYYTWGSGLGLGLDLTLRTRFGTTLDHYMRAMWAEFGAAERPYALDDLQRVLGEVSGDTEFSAEFFARFVRGREAMNYRELLEPAGFLVRKAREGRAWFGSVTAIDGKDGVVVSAEPTVGSPSYDAGLARGDRILSVDGTAVAKPEDLDRVINRSSPGDLLKIGYWKNGETGAVAVKLTEDPTLMILTFENAGLDVTPAVLEFRSDWLESKAAH
ncbi:MAG: M61 family metallopeptidase [Rhodothermia bacterium]